MTVKLLTEHHMEFLSLKGGCTGSSESTLVIIPHCWKSHVVAQFKISMFYYLSPDLCFFLRGSSCELSPGSVQDNKVSVAHLRAKSE